MTSRSPQTQTQPFALAADRLFDGSRVLVDHAVVVSGDTISAVLPVAALDPNIPLRREPGATIIPGLIDTHIHLMRWESPLFMAAGVTTVRDVGNDLDWILDQRRRAADDLRSQRVLSLGPLLDGPSPNHPTVAWPCGDEQAVAQAIERLVAAGVDGTKLYVFFPTDLLPLAVRASHAAGLKVSKHCLKDGVLVAGRAGVDEFFHLDGILADVWPDHPPAWLDGWGLPGMKETLDAQKRVADEIARMGMVSTPTLAYWDSQWRIRTPGRAAGDDSPDVPACMVAWQGTAAREQGGADQWRRGLEAAQRFTGLLLGRGVRTLAGTDVPCGAITAGLSLWREMELLVGSGMSPTQALRSATSDAADFLERPKLGRLAAGATADLAVVRGDPTREIPAKPEVTLVMREGVTMSPAEILADARRANPTGEGDPWSTQFAWHAAKRKAKAS
ncbi:MAG: amidohydrolase family protein [Planctomycetota bacterium]|nr:amidohydrolase family protein [Planctomycetota bacterium]